MKKRTTQNNLIMSRDFKPGLETSSWQSGSRNNEVASAHWIGLVTSVVLLATIFFLVTNNAKATRSYELDETAKATNTNITLPLAIPGSSVSDNFSRSRSNTGKTNHLLQNSSDKNASWKTTTVNSGDSMAVIFSRVGLSPQALDQVMRASKETSILKRLMPGQNFTFLIDNNELQHLVYEIDALNTLNVKRNSNNGFDVSSNTRTLETRVANTTGSIDSSLFLAAQEAGLSDNLIMELAGIFGWDIDFALDIRSGDNFTLVYEEHFLDGQKHSDGNIIAAEFTNRNKTHRALRYTDANNQSDYFSPDGKSMRKEFLRTPVDFTRISSRFGKRRHPILNKMKNHHGVDYVAPRGTPIKAAGDGKLTFVGRKGGYGKTVMIQHGGKYSTLYAHMSRIKPGMRRGKKVRQGQIIGYVGSTGRSTGPHLHYEFRVNGVHRNPLRVRLPDAAPIKAEYREDFFKKTRSLVSILDVLTRTTLALNDDNQ